MRNPFPLLILGLIFVGFGFSQGNRRTAPLKPTKGKVEISITPLWTPTSLQDLEKKANIIVEASVESVEPSRVTNPDNPASLETDYILAINDIIGGDKATIPGKIVVSQLGGKKGELEVVAPQNPPMQVGEKYILFLNRDQRAIPTANSAMSRYEIAGVWSGKLKIENGRVQAVSPATNALREHDREPVEQFVDLVRKQISASPQGR